MRLALHIFKKDIRHLRFEIAVAISVIAAFTSIEVRRALLFADPGINGTTATALVMILLPLTWWTLIGRAIHDEALPGDRQFWITRPYSWRSLLGAKVLFILAFINLPMLIADVVIIRAYGLSLGRALPGLIWSQVLLTVVFLLPIFALSALTTGSVQLILAILAPCVIALIFATLRPGTVLFLAMSRPGLAFNGFEAGYAFGYEWIRSYALFLVISTAGSAILLWQYARRGSFIARCFAAAIAILLFMGATSIPWTAAFKTQSWLSKERVDLSAAHADYDLNDTSLGRVLPWGDQMGVELPLHISGLPPDVSAQVEGFSAEFDAPDGSMRRADQLPLRNFVNMGQHFSLRPTLGKPFYKQVKDAPLTVHGSLYLTVYGNRQLTRVPIGDGSVQVPRVGVCSATQTTGQTTNRRNYFVNCSSAFRDPLALVSYRFLESAKDFNKQEFPLRQHSRVSYSPFPADIGISPVYRDFEFASSSIPWEEVVVGTMEPLAHIRLNFEIHNLRLSDFVVPRWELSH